MTSAPVSTNVISSRVQQYGGAYCIELRTIPCQDLPTKPLKHSYRGIFHREESNPSSAQMGSMHRPSIGDGCLTWVGCWLRGLSCAGVSREVWQYVYVWQCGSVAVEEYSDMRSEWLLRVAVYRVRISYGVQVTVTVCTFQRFISVLCVHVLYT